MAEPTIQEVFGANSAQDENTLTLTKADYGDFTPSANNSGEAVFTAVFLESSTKFTEENQAADSDISITILKTGQTNITRNALPFIRHSYTVSFDVPDETSVIKPSAFDV